MKHIKSNQGSHIFHKYYREIIPLFSVANYKARVLGITHYQGWCEGWCGKWKTRICKSSYGRKLFSNVFFISIYVNLNGFMANIYEYGNTINICSQEPYRSVQCAFFPRACQHFLVYRRNFNCLLQGTLYYNLGEGGLGFMTLWRR
jgi:hypothetical protein